MKTGKDKREFIRGGIKQLASIILNQEGSYELIEGSPKVTPVSIVIQDISFGGVCIILDKGLKKGTLIDLEIPKIRELDAEVIKCEVTRSLLKHDDSDPVLNKKTYSDPFYEIGLKFKDHDIEYLKQFIELTKTKTI